MSSVKFVESKMGGAPAPGTPPSYATATCGLVLMPAAAAMVVNIFCDRHALLTESRISAFAILH